MKEFFEKIKRVYMLSSGPIFIVACFWLHVWLAYFFIKIDILPVAILSIISCIVYVIPLFMKRDNLEQNVIFLIFSEISVFSLLSTMVLSLRCGFFIYCLPLPLTSYIEITNPKRRKYLFLSTTIAMLLLVPLSGLAEGIFHDYRERMAPYEYMFLVNNFFVVVAAYAINVYVYMRKRERMVKETKYKSEHDALTGLNNRNYFNQYIADALKKGPLSGCFIMVDIDNFKKINDQFGHDVGDTALKSVSSIVRKMVRDDDLFVRWGGEEFVLFLEDVSLKDAEEKAELIRKTVADTPYQSSKHLTVSLGVTGIHKGEKYESALKRADDNLYVAKTTGKNKVVVQ